VLAQLVVAGSSTELRRASVTSSGSILHQKESPASRLSLPQIQRTYVKRRYRPCDWQAVPLDASITGLPFVLEGKNRLLVALCSVMAMSHSPLRS
jgi:hypothetical protein